MSKNYLSALIMLLLYAAAQGQECEWLDVGNGPSTQIGTAIAVDNNNDVIAVGYYTDSFSIGNIKLTNPYALAGSQQGFIAKYRNDGAVKWAVQTHNRQNSTTELLNVKTDKDNNIFVLAQYNGFADFGNGLTFFSSTSFNIVILKYNSAGVAQWGREISDAGQFISSSLITVDSNKNVSVAFIYRYRAFISGTSASLVALSGNDDVGLVKYDNAGNYVNAATYNIQHSSDGLMGFDNDDNGNFYLSGMVRGNYNFGPVSTKDTALYILKTDLNFNPINEHRIKKAGITISLNNYAPDNISVTPGGNVAVCGQFSETTDFGGTVLAKSLGSSYSSFVTFYDQNFNLRWVKKDDVQSGSIWISPFAGISMRGNNIYFGGNVSFTGKTNYGPFPIETTSGFGSQFMAKMDTLGNFLWVFSTGDIPATITLLGTAVDFNGNFLITGLYTDSLVVFNEARSGNGHYNYEYYAGKIVDYSITRGNVYAGPYCAGDSLVVPYTKMGKYKPGNEFIAQLSDSAGNFEGNERELGRITDTAGGLIKGILPLFNVASSGKYRIRIISTNPAVQSFYRKDTLRLLIYSKDTANAGPDILLCKGESVRLGTTGGSRWLWSPPTFMISLKDTGNRQPLVKPDSSTEYRIIISDSSGCGITDTDYVKVIINPPLHIDIPDTFIFCKGQPGMLSANVLGGDSLTYHYTWKTESKDSILSYTGQLMADTNSMAKYWLFVSDTCYFDSALVVSIPLPKLNLSLNPDTTICKGETAQLRATATGGKATAYKINWATDNSTWTDTNFTTTVTPDSTTIYTAILSDGCTTSPDTAQIKVTVRPPLKITVNSDTTICMGEKAELRATVTGGLPANWKVNWKADNSTWTDTKFTETVNPTATTNHTVVLSDNCTKQNDSATIKVTVRPSLKITVNKDTTICYAGSVNLVANTGGGLNTNHHILWKENTSSWTDTNFTLIVSPPTTTTYTAILTDNCTTSPDSAKVTVTVLPQLSVTATAKDSICQGQTVTLNATLNGGKTAAHILNWTAIPGTFSSNQNPANDTPTVNTTYIAKLSDNCSPNAYDTINVVVLPKPKADFSLFPAAGCPPLSVTFTDLSANTDSAKNTWHILTSEAYGVKSYTHEFLYSGSFSIGLTVGNSLGCTDFINKPSAITVFEKPTANFTVKPDIKEVEKELLLINNSQKANQYLWDFGDGNRYSQNTKNDTTYEYKDSGYYNLSLIAENDKGCKGTSTQLIRIHDRLYCAIPNAFTPGNLDNLNPVFMPTCMGVKSYTLTIYNRWGQVIQNCENCSWDGTYMDKPVSSETYLYKIFITAESGKKETVFGTVNVVR